jgi:hypothetical protein
VRVCIRFCLTLYHLQADAADPPQQRQNGMSILRKRTLCVAQIGWRFCSWFVAMLRPELPKQSIAAKTEAAGIRSESSSLCRAERSYRPPPHTRATVRACSSRYARGSSGLAAAGCDCFPARFSAFTVITTDPNEVVQPLHDRMPVIIPERHYDRWLDVSNTERLPVDLLRPYDAEKMTAWKVDKAVGNVKNDRPELIEPASAAPEEVKEGVEDSPGPLFS